MKKSLKSNLILGGILAFILITILVLDKPVNFNEDLTNNNLSASIKTALAQEIYPLFGCPCCDKTIDVCTCPMAGERRTYIDDSTETSEQAVIKAYVEKYGLDSFKDQAKKEEFKKELIEQAPASRPIISLTPDTYDFGNISQQNGVVITFFEIKNKGQEDLIIDRLETSCGCTSALVVFQEQAGPEFAMPGHGINEKIKDWQVLIPAGETAQLKVFYDPNIHQDFRGAAIREIYVFSNDPINFQMKVKIELNQVD